MQTTNKKITDTETDDVYVHVLDSDWRNERTLQYRRILRQEIGYGKRFDDGSPKPVEEKQIPPQREFCFRSADGFNIYTGDNFFLLQEDSRSRLSKHAGGSIFQASDRLSYQRNPGIAQRAYKSLKNVPGNYKIISYDKIALRVQDEFFRVTKIDNRYKITPGTIQANTSYFDQQSNPYFSTLFKAKEYVEQRRGTIVVEPQREVQFSNEEIRRSAVLSIDDVARVYTTANEHTQYSRQKLDQLKQIVKNKLKTQNNA